MDQCELNSADRRTNLAEDRTLLANERTFAGWMRTSLACIAIGIGFHALFSRVELAWLTKGIATGFLLLAVLVIVLAERRAAAVINRLDAHNIRSTRAVNLRLYAVIITIGVAGLIPAIWTMAVD